MDRVRSNRLSPTLQGVLLLVSALAIQGCGTLVRESAPGPWIEAQLGGTLTLNRPVQVPEGRARAFFLRGRIQSAGAGQGPSCGIEIRTIPCDGPHVIPAGSFTITRVQPYWTQVASLAPGRDRDVARLWSASATDGGGSPLIQEGYHLWLNGGPDPNVMRLTCLGSLDELWRARPPTLDEIRGALGGLATLTLPPRLAP